MTEKTTGTIERQIAALKSDLGRRIDDLETRIDKRLDALQDQLDTLSNKQSKDIEGLKSAIGCVTTTTGDIFDELREEVEGVSGSVVKLEADGTRRGVIPETRVLMGEAKWMAVCVSIEYLLPARSSANWHRPLLEL
jgi:hypothetical protein